MKNFNTIKKIVLGLFLTLSGTIPVTSLKAQAPGGPVVPGSFIPEGISLPRNPLSRFFSWELGQSNMWDTLCFSTTVAITASKEVAYVAGKTLDFGLEAFDVGVEATLAAADLVKRASLFTYALAKNGWSATKWTAHKTHELYRWASGKTAQERAELAAVHSRLTVAPSNFS